jgi:hypothetical protein
MSREEDVLSRSLMICKKNNNNQLSSRSISGVDPEPWCASLQEDVGQVGVFQRDSKHVLRHSLTGVTAPRRLRSSGTVTVLLQFLSSTMWHSSQRTICCGLLPLNSLHCSRGCGLGETPAPDGFGFVGTTL